jgi:hypothetical protein
VVVQEAVVSVEAVELEDIVLQFQANLQVEELVQNL